MDTPTPERFAQAMNEHGYLLQQRIQHKLKGLSQNQDFIWSVEASEFPIATYVGVETKIDLVLRWKHSDDMKVSVECKRAYKKPWLFWDTEAVVRVSLLEQAAQSSDDDI